MKRAFFAIVQRFRNEMTIVLFAFALPGAVSATALPRTQESAQLPELIPGARYDAGIPTLKQVVGHDFREEITSPEDIVRYF